MEKVKEMRGGEGEEGGGGSKKGGRWREREEKGKKGKWEK